MWKIDHLVSKGDYNYAVVYGHPNATKNNYVLEHRIVIENFLSRLLREDEIVHHKDENKKNNVISNLEIHTNQSHCILHAKQGRTQVSCLCDFCGEEFVKEKRQIKKNYKKHFCNRKCYWAYNLTHKMPTF